MFPKRFNLVIWIVVSLQLKGAACFFVKRLTNVYSGETRCIKDTGQIQSNGSWGNLSYLEFSYGSCLDPAGQFRFRDNGAILNVKRRGCLAAFHRNGSDYDLDLFYLYVDSVSLDTAACAQKPNEGIYRAIKLTRAKKLSVYYKGKDKSSFETWCATMARTSKTPLYKKYGIFFSLGLTTRCDSIRSYEFIFGSVTCYGDKVKNANCPKNQYIAVKFASYRGLLGSKTCGSSDDYSCEVDLTCLVKKQCDGLRECNITVDDDFLSGNHCPGLSNYLYFEFHCVDALKHFKGPCVQDVSLSISSQPYKGVAKLTIDGVTKNACWRSKNYQYIVCRQLGYESHNWESSVVSVPAPTDAKDETFYGSINCDDANYLSQCSISASASKSCSQLTYIDCGFSSDRPLLEDNQTFPDSSFSASASLAGHSASDARISSGSSWCAPVSDDKHYLQVDLRRVYRLYYLVTYGDSSSQKWVVTYKLDGTIDLVNWKTLYWISRGNKNAYIHAAWWSFSECRIRGLRFIPLSYVVQPCMRVMVWGESLTHDQPWNLTVANITSRSAEISWLDPKNNGRYGLSRIELELKEEKSGFNLIRRPWIRKVNEYKLDNLTPFTRYQVSVAAGNRYGISGATIISFVTLEEGSSNFSKSNVTTPLPPTTVSTLATTKPPPVYLYVTPVDPKVVEKSSVVLSCNCGCSIPLQWFKNNQSIRFVGPGSPYILLANGSLYMNVSRLTAGNYSCEVRTIFWRMRSKQVNLEVWYLDDVYVNGDQEIYRGQNISLSCHGNGNPQPIFTWYIHGQQLQTNSPTIIQENQLHIFNATVNDGGEYVCVAYNQAGNVSRAVVVTVKDIPPILIMAYSPKYSLVGSAIQFGCYEVRKDIQKLELVKDGIPSFLWLVRRSFGRYTTGWYNARQNDTGKYQCKGSIGAASRYSSPIYLVIGIPSGPVVLEKEPDTSITGIKISWKRISKEFWNGEQITFKVNVFSVNNYVLQKSYATKTTSAIISGLLPATKYIVNVTGKTVFGPIQNLTVAVKTKENFDKCESADSNSCHEYAHCENVVGTYICTCFEGFFGDGKECQGPPQITSKSPANITEFVETNVTLVCTVIAYPNPTTVWKRIDPDGKIKEIKRTSDKFDGNYTIYNARLEDSGKYICNASNILGYESYTIDITIKPVIVNIGVEINLSNKTFKEELKNKYSLAYKKLEQDVHDELYIFFNNTPGFEGIEILGFVNGSVRVLFQVIVKVLKPSKERRDVVAVSVGRKIFKQLKTGRIGKLAVKPGVLKINADPPPPANVTYSDVRETRVHIYWQPPELHELFSIERYYIFFLKHGYTEWSNKTIDSTDLTNFQLDNLESDTFYILKITAANACCLGQESKRMEIKTLKVKVVSSWYYIGPIIAVACIILLVIIICLVRRVSVSGTWRPVKDRNQNWDEKEPKTSFQMTERRKENENTYANIEYSEGYSNNIN